MLVTVKLYVTCINMPHQDFAERFKSSCLSGPRCLGSQHEHERISE